MNLNKFYFLLFIILITFFDVVGDAVSKKWAIDSKLIYMIIILVSYCLSGLFWAVSLKFQDLSKGVVLLNTINILIIVLIGVFYFKEELTTPNKIGIVLGLVSIGLLQ